MENNEKLIDKFNHLLERTYDAKNGFLEAGNAASYGPLRKFLFDQAEQREQFAAELGHQVIAMGGDPETSTSLVADLHRFWIDFKNGIVSNDNVMVLEECVRGEEKALEDYREVLREVVLKSEQYEMITRHINAIENNIKAANLLIDSLKEVNA